MNCMDEVFGKDKAAPTLQWNGPSPGYTIGISAVLGYRTSNPVTARPMIIRWISLVPSKIAKIMDYLAVSAGQRPVGRRGISTDPARGPRGMTVFVQPVYVFERGSDAR
jgi:hypothetical protein